MALFGDKKNNGEAKKAAVKPAKAVKPAAKKEAASMQDLYAEKSVSSAAHPAAKKAASVSKAAAYRVLVRPLITEKATDLVAAGKYVFQVALKANKIEIAKAINAIYGVKPLKVNLLNVSGKKVSRGRVKGQRSDWRKAIVTLAKGETIKVYEGV